MNLFFPYLPGDIEIEMLYFLTHNLNKEKIKYAPTLLMAHNSTQFCAGLTNARFRGYFPPFKVWGVFIIIELLSSLFTEGRLIQI